MAGFETRTVRTTAALADIVCQTNITAAADTVLTKSGGVVVYQGGFTRTNAAFTAGFFVATLPVGFRPAADVIAVSAVSVTGPAPGPVHFYIAADGTIKLNNLNPPANCANFKFAVSYFVGV